MAIVRRRTNRCDETNVVDAFRAEKPEEFADADDAATKDDESEIDLNRIDEEMFNKVIETNFSSRKKIRLVLVSLRTGRRTNTKKTKRF